MDLPIAVKDYASIYGALVYLLILLINNNVSQLSTLFFNQEVYVSLLLSLVSFEVMRLTILLMDRTSLALKNKIPFQIFTTTVMRVAMVLSVISQYYK